MAIATASTPPINSRAIMWPPLLFCESRPQLHSDKKQRSANIAVSLQNNISEEKGRQNRRSTSLEAVHPERFKVYRRLSPGHDISNKLAGRRAAAQAHVAVAEGVVDILLLYRGPDHRQ